MSPAVGISHSISRVVQVEDTAHRMGNEGVRVLGTPQLVLFAETACHELLVPFLAAGEATVGTRVDIRHLKATPVGENIRIKARLAAIDRRRYVFRVEAQDRRGAILSGEHERAVVELAPFLAKVQASFNPDGA